MRPKQIDRAAARIYPGVRSSRAAGVETITALWANPFVLGPILGGGGGVGGGGGLVRAQPRGRGGWVGGLGGEHSGGWGETVGFGGKWGGGGRCCGRELVRSGTTPWAGGLGVRSRFRIEPSQATIGCSPENQAGAWTEDGENKASDHQ